MTAEIGPLRPPTRIVGEHLRCPVCNVRDAYANIGAQSFAFSRRHSMVWYVGQNYSDKWLRQTPSQWAVNKHHLDRWDARIPGTPAPLRRWSIRGCSVKHIPASALKALALCRAVCASIFNSLRPRRRVNHQVPPEVLALDGSINSRIFAMARRPPPGRRSGGRTPRSEEAATRGRRQRSNVVYLLYRHHGRLWARPRPSVHRHDSGDNAHVQTDCRRVAVLGNSIHGGCVRKLILT
jgi:hypothetical protein